MNPEDLNFEVRVAGRLIGVATSAEHVRLINKAIRDGIITEDDAAKEVELRLVHDNK